jgi:tetratricopeptide (TPR) repeat protein/CHAT domain-containing protein
MAGLFIVDGSFELLCGGSATGSRRHLDKTEVAELEGFAAHYGQLLKSRNAAAGLLALGHNLFGWLDGDLGELNKLLQQAPRPVRFEICAANFVPTSAEWSLLRAPWELLANEHGFLARDFGLGFVPVRRLGRQVAAPALDQHRLGLVFMAASPDGALELDYEAEETAIMEAVGSTKLDLLVEESGNAKELGERLTDYEAMQVLHLSCHGHNAWQSSDKPQQAAKPVLLLETLEGGELPTGADELISALRAHRPRLVFLSACLTAAAGGEKRGGQPGDKDGSTGTRNGVAHSLAEALVSAGLPAVLGWDGSVADIAATAFAAALYDGLEERQDLAGAVAAARRDLLNASEPGKQRDWHLARLWLGPQGGGPIVGGDVRRAMMPATHGRKEFLVKERQQVPVASHEMFVGRRRELQKAMRALRDGEHSGVLVHGMGRLGKSSLAFRIANRRRDLRLAVMFEHYGALDVLDALAKALKENPKARELLRKGTDLVRQDPDRLEGLLIDLLRGPCGQMAEGGTPVLLVIDDLERILDADPKGGRHRVKPDNAQVLGAVLRAFDAAIHAGNSRFLITSRHPFTLDGLEDRLFELQLPPLSEAAQRKLELRQKEAAADAGLTGKAFDERTVMLARVPGIARGNPGLQDLIGRKLVLSAVVPMERAKQALDEMAAWLKRGDLPSDTEVRAFLENLAVDALLDLAGKGGRAFLRKLTLFDVPVPQGIAEQLAAMDGVLLAHMRDVGVVDTFTDMVDHRRAAFAVNALAAGRLEPLTDSERDMVADAVTHELFDAWGGAKGSGQRPSVCDLQLARLGLLAEDGEVVAACAIRAVLAMRGGPAAAGLALGREAIELLDQQQRVVPWRLLSETARAASTSGDGGTADTLLERGVAALEEQRRSGTTVDPAAALFLVYEQAQRLVTRGELDQAQRLFAETARLAEAAGREISATIARGAIADILFSRGELDEALRIRREDELPVYERLGDVRSRAVTMGKIADILVSRGELDEALRIRREEQLPVYERLGDVRSRALTMGQIADILVSRGELDEALRIHREEQLPVYERLGDVRSRAVTMGKIADILVRRGELDEALRIRREDELPVYERLGDVRSRAVTMGQIADILESRGELEEALRIRREEQLPVYERLGDVRSRAVTMGRIADILAQRGDVGAARALQVERLAINRQLNDADGIGATLWDLAQLDLAEQKIDDAVPRILEAYEIMSKLGRAEGIAVIGKPVGQLLAANEQPDHARAVLRRSAEMYQKLGRDSDAKEVEQLIRQLGLA